MIKPSTILGEPQITVSGPPILGPFRVRVPRVL